jgi:hypothetical protein
VSFGSKSPRGILYGVAGVVDRQRHRRDVDQRGRHVGALGELADDEAGDVRP